MFHPGAVQALREVGRADRGGFSRGHPAIQRNVPAAFRHPGKTRSSSAPGHGGNEHLLPFFAQAQLDRPHDYVVYVLDGERSRPGGPPKKSTAIDYHAGENETSNTMVSRPDLVHIERAATESGIDQKRLHLPEDVYTGIWWYARFPNHYSGDGSVATRELGEWNMN